MGPEPISKAWLIAQFDSLHTEHMTILEQISAMTVTISPELEAQVRKAKKLSANIDAKVPDLPGQRKEKN